jgi:hypothetical protein
VVPGEDGNYYRNILMSAQKKKADFKLGAIGWLDWLKEAINSGIVEIDQDFGFDPKRVRVVTFTKK